MLAIFCFGAFWPLSVQNGPFRSQMHPFRTLKVQHGGGTTGVGSRSASHTLPLTLFSTLKTAQDARQFFVWRFLAPSRSKMDLSVPKFTHVEF
jgi:hypothetical protein